MFKIFRKLFYKKGIATANTVEQPIAIDKTKEVAGETIEDIIQIWRRTDLKLNTPATQDLLKYTQQKIGYSFPDDFIRFYEQVNGFKDWDTIGDMFSIWTLERILEEYEKSDDKNFVPFCDYCIDCHRIGYLKDEAGIYKDHYQVNKIADTFDETIKLILEDSSILF